MATLAGVDPSWSRFAQVEIDGRRRRVHALVAEPPRPAGTIVCVHGNPTWAYLWREVLIECGEAYRVIAIDHLGMGYSERGPRRTLAQRVDDLGVILDGFGIDGPVTLVAHDWGGPIALGWAARHRERVERLVLMNTGVELPPGGVPVLIRLANLSVLRSAVCTRTPLFLEAALALTRGLTADERAAYRAPYRSRRRRRAIADFVADIPTHPTHPSSGPLAEIAAATADLAVPTLLIWGARDPVFTDVTLADLRRRLPRAEVARYPEANHLVPDDVPVGAVVRRWLTTTPVTAPSPGFDRPLTAALAERAATTPEAAAVVDLGSGAAVSAHGLHDLVARLASGLHGAGARRGDRVAMLVPVGVPLIAAVYACWQLGLVPVIADRGLGLRGIRRALRSTQPPFALTTSRIRLAARTARLAPAATFLDVDDLADARPTPDHAPPAIAPAADEPAAVLFTSGATGPAKGVRYTHGQLVALRGSMTATFGVTGRDALVAAFAPFALLGPALGIPVAIPDMDVTAPATLRADALADACRAVSATLVFAAPAALASVAGGDLRLGDVRMVLSAGAPVPPDVLAATRRLFPAATMHTPYGMTEVLVVTSGEEPLPPERGVHVGRPVDGAEVRILPLGFDASKPPDPVDQGATGEIAVSAPWCSEGYDGLWPLQTESRFELEGRVWHRTGDVGHLDAAGLWIEGRVGHVVHTRSGPVTPVGIEEAVRASTGRRVALVGVGPASRQALVVVLEGPGPEGVVDAETADVVRALVPEVAAVCRRRQLPVDIRHNSKIDRTAVARWAEALLRGGRA